MEGYYEYKVISLTDESGFFNKKSGRVNVEAMSQTLNNLGKDGWHLITAYSNELGKNEAAGGIAGAVLGVNSTVDENILIFERFVEQKSYEEIKSEKNSALIEELNSFKELLEIDAITQDDYDKKEAELMSLIEK